MAALEFVRVDEREESRECVNDTLKKLHTHTHTHTLTHTPARAHTHTHARTHARTHTHSHTKRERPLSLGGTVQIQRRVDGWVVPGSTRKTASWHWAERQPGQGRVSRWPGGCGDWQVFLSECSFVCCSSPVLSRLLICHIKWRI